MRFLAQGPLLPDELLTARDAGQVLFFCGAGVSQSEAHLPNFGMLAEDVLSLLGSALDSPARRLFDAARAFEKASGLTGLVATDRIFGMLEREFEPSEVREAVAIALRPKPGYCLRAHQTLLDLSRTRAGVPRLVTTNFDLLFEECDPSIASSNPPHLPDPGREVDFRGIVHLHGRVDPEYRRARDDEFVLSSADFGRAYLSDGWATRYIQSLLQRFKIVFVGYSADDPPVQYLLEALSRSAKPQNALYAFQSGDIAEAVAQWEHKGVEPIAYNSANGHAALWTTLYAWAERARDVDNWHDRLIASAARGPGKLAPHERGMVAHLASTTAGARRLATAHVPIPASWFCVLDRNARYGQAGQVDIYNELSPRFDPFDEFGLDSDEAPEPIDPSDRFAKRATPETAWDGMMSTALDRFDLPLNASGQLRGNGADVAAELPPRLWHLAAWLVRVAHEPAALWWASGQGCLHPSIQQRIESALCQEAARFSPAVRRGWRALLASWKQGAVHADRLRYEIEAKAKLEGWSSTLVREAMEMYRPILTVKAPFGVKAPEPAADEPLKDIVRIDVEYPRPHLPLSIPADQLDYAVTLFRQHLEYAVQLEREANGHDDLFFDTTRPDDDGSLDEDYDGVTGHLVTFTNMVGRLVVENRTAARTEFSRWLSIGGPIFTRLRIWAAGRLDFLTAEEAAAIFLSLDDETFWTSRHERDLLFALRDRWAGLPASVRKRLEGRLCEGHFPWKGETNDLPRIVAHYRLNRLHWLSTHGVAFSFDYDAELTILRSIAPDWQTRFGDQVARPSVSGVYTIESDIDPGELLETPLSEVLQKATELGQRDFDTRIQREPFRGLAADRPARALAVLTHAAKHGAFAPRAWSALLHAEGKAAMSRRMLAAIGLRLARLPVDQLAAIASPVAEWLRKRGERLLIDLPHVFDMVWSATIAALASISPEQRFRRPDRGWVDEGLNTPVGSMVEAVLKDPAKTDFKPNAGLPTAWRKRFDQLLGLPGDHRPHAIVMITPRLNWLFQIDPGWTEERLLSLAKGAGDDTMAFWAGYFWGAQVPQFPLYQRLKPEFVALARTAAQRREHANKLAGMLLAGWGGDEYASQPESLIPDVELREVLIHADDELRTQMLWYLERWVLKPDSRWGDRLVPFLRDVWPRQRAVRTARVSGRLADLALAIPDRFPEIVEVILPRLARIKGASLRMTPFLSAEDGIAALHPLAMLNLLWVILAEDPFEWPYETGKILSQLTKQSATKDDPRLAELRRREQYR